MSENIKKLNEQQSAQVVGGNYYPSELREDGKCEKMVEVQNGSCMAKNAPCCSECVYYK